MPIPADWYAHRRADGEYVGWIVPDGDRFRAVDLLGRCAGSTSVEWVEAEETLAERGIGYLSDPYILRLDDGTERAVRIAEVSGEGVTVVADEFGAASVVGATHERFTLPFPVPANLRPRR